MEVPVYLDGAQRGTLRAEQRGLYTHFYGQLQETALCRIYGVFSGGELSLGVPVPEKGKMVLRASMPTARLPGGQLLSGKIVCRQDAFRPFPGGKMGDVTLPAGQRKGNLFRFPWALDQPLPAEEFLCFYRLVRENGRLYLELRLREDGTPEV